MYIRHKSNWYRGWKNKDGSVTTMFIFSLKVLMRGKKKGGEETHPFLRGWFFHFKPPYESPWLLVPHSLPLNE